MGAEEGNMCFRIGLRTKGCNGMAYTLEYAEPDSKLKFEEQVNHILTLSQNRQIFFQVTQEGVSIIIDMKAQMTLLGTEMDYSSNKLESGFIFNNPNIKGTCGCGESFNI